MSTTHRDELRDRVEAKKKELEAKLHQANADARAKAREATEEVERKLRDLGRMIADGWDEISEKTAQKLDDWLKRA